MAQNNATILEKAWLEGTNDYQQRVPNPSQSTIAQTMDAIFAPGNGIIYNQFIDALVNRIGMTYVHQSEWRNPLAVFKKGKLNYGSTVQEVAPKWIKAHSYLTDSETLLKLRRPEVQQCFHSLNRQDRYDISIIREELMNAFVDDFGLNNLVASIMTVPINSDNYDEYRIMLNLIGEYESRWGFYKHHLSAAPTDETSSKELLRAIRTYRGLLKFPSTLYNAGVIDDIPVWASPDELVLMMTPETEAAIDVEALAMLFNMDKAEAQVRTVIVDEFPIPNAYALLTTDAFYQVWDKLYTTESFYNPETLANNYFLHHWSVCSVSPFVPSILFTTDDGTVTKTIKQTVTSLQIASAADTAKPGDKVQLTLTLNGNLSEGASDYTGDAIEIAPDAATYAVTAKTAGDNAQAIQLNTRTYVDRNGLLHIQKSNLNKGDVLTVEAHPTYYDPSTGTKLTTPASVSITID